MTYETKQEILRNLYLQKSFGYDYIDPISLKNNENEDFYMSQETLEHCSLCDGAKYSKTKIYGAGDIDAEILFITIVPTFEKLEKEMFEKMITHVLGLSLNSIYLTSIIKCDINENNSNLKEYTKTCKGFLENQLKKSNAKIIVFLGESFNLFFDNNVQDTFTKGRILKYQNKNVFSIYHPNFLLRNPSLKKDVFEDLKKIKLLLEES
jgi:DNA polymerase